MQKIIDPNFCNSSFLAFRYIVKKNVGWSNDFVPEFPDEGAQGIYPVSTPEEILNRIRQILSSIENEKVGLLLSGGIDSAILAALLPKETKTFTVRFNAKNACDESIQAKKYANIMELQHYIIDIGWKDYDNNMDDLMEFKKAPLHPAEVGIYLAAKKAKEEGVDLLLVGNGADSTFGGMDKLLSKDWKFEEFIKRYTFLNPFDVLKNPVDVFYVYERFKTESGIDVLSFLKTVHGLGIIQTFETAVRAAGCKISAPYEFLSLKGELNIEKIRAGESKYLLREVFKKLYPNLTVPEKIAFARPMDEWMSSWSGPKREEFKENLDINSFTGEQKWLIYCLERFLNLMEKD